MGQIGENGSNRWKLVKSVKTGQNDEITKINQKSKLGFKIIQKVQITVYYAMTGIGAEMLGQLNFPFFIITRLRDFNFFLWSHLLTCRNSTNACLFIVKLVWPWKENNSKAFLFMKTLLKWQTVGNTPSSWSVRRVACALNGWRHPGTR